MGSFQNPKVRHRILDSAVSTDVGNQTTHQLKLSRYNFNPFRVRGHLGNAANMCWLSKMHLLQCLMREIVYVNYSPCSVRVVLDCNEKYFRQPNQLLTSPKYSQYNPMQPLGFRALVHTHVLSLHPEGGVFWVPQQVGCSA